MHPSKHDTLKHVALTLAQRLRDWPNIKSCFAGIDVVKTSESEYYRRQILSVRRPYTERVKTLNYRILFVLT